MYRSNRKIWLCFIALAWAVSARAATVQPTGYYVMMAVHSQNVADSVIASKSLTGFHLRDSWDLLEPTKGVFDFAWYDEQLARATKLNKHVTFGLYAGAANDPAWGNSAADFAAAVAALGARYGSNPLIDGVHLSAPQVTDNSMEMFLPSSWTGTDAAAIAIWENCIDVYNKAFPTKALILDVAMAPSGNGAITRAVDEYARSVLGARLNAIICSLKATTGLTAPHIVELSRLHGEGVRTGGEMVGPSTDTARFGGPFSTALTIGKNLGMSWYQVYQADVASLPAVPPGTPEPSGFVGIAIALCVFTLTYRRAAR